MYQRILALVFTLFVSSSLFAQEEDLFEMSLEDLMNVEIVSASKKEESLFDAPVSSYSITREEIEKAGVTSIPEALRLCPGVIVREMTNGNYDIHLRGLDNITRYAVGTQVNFQTLLMVDNRPVFNYTYGAIIWEALPVDLIDVERIEIVRGPSAPLFGPNALTGVINIITRKPEQPGWYAKANAQYGMPQSLIGNVAVGKKFNDKTSLVISGNYQERMRHDDLFYSVSGDEYLESIADLPRVDTLYPEPELALRKQGVNAFFNHRVNDQVQFDLSLGAQAAEVQRDFIGSSTALEFSSTNSEYVNLASSIYGFGAKVSYTHAHDRFSYNGASDLALEFDGDIIDLVLDYQWDATSRLSIRPTFNYQSATYDDSKYAAESPFGGLFNRQVTTNGIAGALRIDYDITDAWRLIGSARADKFNKPDDVYLSYQFASTYKVSDKYLLRAVYAKSSSSAFAFRTATDIDIVIDLGLSPVPGQGPQFVTSLLGNPDVKLSTVDMAEIGFRAKITDHLQFDVDIFRQQAQDHSAFVDIERTTQPTGLPAPFPPVVPATEITRIENFPTKAVQQGLTLAVNFVPSTKLQIKPFITLQQTKVTNIPRVLNAFPIDSTNQYNLYNGFDDDNRSTPTFYGGAFIHGSITPKLQANLNAYFFGSHTQYSAADNDPGRMSTAGDIDGKLILSSKVSYRILPSLQLYANVRNLLGTDSREYHGTDRIGRTIFFGANFSL